MICLVLFFVCLFAFLWLFSVFCLFVIGFFFSCFSEMTRSRQPTFYVSVNESFLEMNITLLNCE